MATQLSMTFVLADAQSRIKTMSIRHNLEVGLAPLFDTHTVEPDLLWGILLSGPGLRRMLVPPECISKRSSMALAGHATGASYVWRCRLTRRR